MNSLSNIIGRIGLYLGLGCLVSMGVNAATSVVAIAAGAAPALSCFAPSQTSCLGPAGFDHTIAGETP